MNLNKGYHLPDLKSPPTIIRASADNLLAKKHVETANLEPRRPTSFTRTFVYTCVALTLVILISTAIFISLTKPSKPSNTSTLVFATEPTLAFTDHEIKALITDSLTSFLSAETTHEKMKHVVASPAEESNLIDYYDNRGNKDATLKAIHLIRPILIGTNQLWVVSYTDSQDSRRNATFERVGNSFQMNWSSSYAYGQLSWEDFSTTRPSKPVQMRAFLLHYNGDLPPGYPADKWAAYVIEDNAGAFTQLAVMARDADGQTLIEQSPSAARLPVNVKLNYENTQHDQPQLMIQQLIHFKWYAGNLSDKGTYSRRVRPGAPGTQTLGIDTLK